MGLLDRVFWLVGVISVTFVMVLVSTMVGVGIAEALERRRIRRLFRRHKLEPLPERWLQDRGRTW